MPNSAGREVRFGILWFVGFIVCAFVGPIAVALLIGSLSSVAALQSVAAWKQARSEVDRQVAAVTPLAAALAALVGVGLSGFVLLFGVVAAVVLALAAPRRRSGVIARAGVTVRCMLLPTITAVAVVSMARTSMSGLLVLLVLVSAYEAGNHLIGTDAGSVFEGPIAGIIAVVVLTFTEATFQFGPFSSHSAWVLGALAAVTAPLGAPLAAAMVPRAQDVGAALRRLDAWLVVAPAWCWVLWNLLGRTH
ncbi:MAG: hypothetical protein F2520_09395 [Actinobacteria bacterium]|nr:hypothetical protein [Actinomycetota bacterium]MTA78463.1 hypothetical protein [Actinomycetota bacterium]